MKIINDQFQRGFPIRYLFLCIVYFILSLFGILHHEIWLDEMHHFLLARDSSNFQELVYNARYDGHPLLWDGLLFLLTHFTHDPFFMQLLHIVISVAAVIIFLRNAPFTDGFKILFVFGYFMFYEYNIISRNYAVSILLLFIACSLIFKARRNYVAIIIALLVLSYTHLFSLICSVSLFLVTILMYAEERGEKIPKIKFQLLCIVYVAMLGVILWSIVPPADHMLARYDTTPYFSFKRIGKGFSIFFKGLYHIPDFRKYSFWNTNIFVNYSKNFSVIPSMICFVIPFFIFYDKPRSVLFFYLSALGIAAFIFWSPIIAGVRYFGFISLLIIIGLWLSEFSPSSSYTILSEKATARIARFNRRFKVPFVYSFLFIQMMSSVAVYSLDIIRPFSEGKAVAAYLKENKLADKIIVVSLQSSGPSICGYLDQKVYYPETNAFGSFCKWNTDPILITKSELISRIKKINFKELTLVVNDSTLDAADDLTVPVYADDELKIFYLTSFHKGIMRSENYRLYDVKKNNME